MPKLIVSMDGLVLNEFALTTGKVQVGRAQNNDIRLDNRAISNEHLRIFLNDDRAYYVEDLDSTNGTTLNGQKITRRELRNNDIIGLGKYCIKYVEDEAFDQQQLTAQGMTFEKTSVEELIAEKNKKAGEPAVPAPATPAKSIYRPRTLTDSGLSASSIPFSNVAFSGEKSAATESQVTTGGLNVTQSSPQARVRLVHGDVIGREVPIDPKKPVRIGRAGHVGRITHENGVWLLAREQGSIPAVNGVAISPQTPHALKHGDRISVGGLSLQFLND